MSSRLAFQTQLASIMEVLANAAVAEICKLVDDDYAVVSLQMSQCQRENKALKRKLHLLELKMARGYAERRLRENATNSGRPRVQISGGDRLQESSCSTDRVFEQQVEVTLWSGRAVVEEAAPQPTHSERIQTKSPDVQLVKPDAPLVKEEKMETNMPQLEEMEPLVDDGEMECVPRAVAGQRLSLEDHDTHFNSAGSHSQIQSRTIKATLTSNRGVEKDEGPDAVLVKVEEVEPVTEVLNQTCLSIQEGLVESSTDDCRGMRPPNETTQTSQNQLSDQQDSGQGFSEVSYGHTSLWTNGGVGNGDCHPGRSSHLTPLSHLPGTLIGADPGSSGRGLAVETSPEGGLAISCFSFEHQPPFADLSVELGSSQLSGQGSKQFLDQGPKLSNKSSMKRFYICSFCGKRFPAPANLESHRRTHTGERPYGCIICGKRFSQFWNLKIHRNIHTGERPYQCSLCPERFSDPSNLKKHQKRHHPQGMGMQSGTS